MMRYLSCLVWLLVASQVFAEDATPLPSAAATLATPAPLPSQLPAERPTKLQLQLEVAETAYLLKKDDQTLGQLVGVLEQAVAPYCMQTLRTGTALPASPLQGRCLATVQRMIEIDPTNAAAICARDGIDATTCVDAYGGQRIEAYQPAAEQSAQAGGLSYGVQQARVAPAVQALEAELYMAIRAREINRTPETEKKVREIFERLIPASCFFSSVIYRTQEQAPRQRVRLLPQECIKNTDEALRSFPGNARALCARDGYYTPACTRARRTEARARSVAPPSPGQSRTPEIARPQRPNSGAELETF